MKSIKNIQEVVGRKSFMDFMIAMNGFADLKEWSEVGGMLNLVRKLLTVFDPDDMIDVGCGQRPTLAALLALNYGSETRIISAIDPQLGLEYGQNLSSYYAYKMKLGEWWREYNKYRHLFTRENHRLLIISNHGHVKPQEVDKFISESVYGRWVYVTCPCCVDNRLTNRRSIHFEDQHMNTPKNKIYIYADDSTFEDIAKIRFERKK